MPGEFTSTSEKARLAISKKAIDHWLESHDSRDILLYQVGAMADDEKLDELRAAIYAERGRPEVER